MKYVKQFEKFDSESNETIKWIKDKFESELSDDKLFFILFEYGGFFGNKPNNTFLISIPLNVRLTARGEYNEPEHSEPVYYSDGQKAPKNKFGKYLPEENRDHGFYFRQISDFILSIKSYTESIGKYKGIKVLFNDVKQRTMGMNKRDWVIINPDNESDLEMLESKKIGTLEFSFED